MNSTITHIERASFFGLPAHPPSLRQSITSRFADAGRRLEAATLIGDHEARFEAMSERIALRRESDDMVERQRFAREFPGVVKVCIEWHQKMVRAGCMTLAEYDKHIAENF